MWRAVDQDGIVLDILVQSQRDKRAAEGTVNLAEFETEFGNHPAWG